MGSLEFAEGLHMTLRRFSRPTTPTAITSAGLAFLTLFGIGIATANTEAVVARRFTAALEAVPNQTVADISADQPLVSGSEAYWLEKRRHDGSGASLEQAAWSSAPLAEGLAVGARVTINNGKDKPERVLEVVSITAVPAVDKSAEGGDMAPNKVVITCRDLSAPDGRIVSFEIPAETSPASRPLI